VKQHFLDMSLDVDTHPITVVGIGDMSGDVFGNGMLRSRHMRLVAAFDHRDVFIDPTPDAASGFVERQRLSSLLQSSWQDYDRSLISEGGGVWSRREKNVVLTDEVRTALRTDATSLTPAELIQVILRAPVDLLWNGGVGTYVKASRESDSDCHDRANDSVRVDAPEIRCSVVGEGGNLGFTQQGRIEYARAGGRVNTDFIDNSGGVDCSDREVNLKILLGIAEERGELSAEDRMALISDVTEDVTDRVLDDNKDQALILSQDEERSVSNLEAYEDLMQTLERHRLLNRELEGLPTTDELVERSKDGRGLTRPELSVLLSYAKQDLKNALIESDVPELPDVLPELGEYFPEKIRERFGHLLADHPLRREILATVLANRVLNDEGITFVNRLVMETGATRAQVVPAYRLAHRLTRAHERWAAVEELGVDVEPALRGELLDAIDWLVESVARWYLARPGGLPKVEELELARDSFAELEGCFADPDFVAVRDDRGTQVSALVAAGVPTQLATRHTYHDELVHAPDIIELALWSYRDVKEVAELFILIGDRYRLDWLERQVEQLSASTRWHRWAIRSLESDLVRLRRDIAEWVLAESDGIEPEAALNAYARSRSERHTRLTQFMQLLAQEGSSDLDPLLVAARQIRTLAG
jgi:glutamate dehydrogenase